MAFYCDNLRRLWAKIATNRKRRKSLAKQRNAKQEEEKRNRRNKRPKFNNTQWSRCVDAFPWPCPCLSSNRQTNKRNEILWFFRFAFLHLFGWRRRIEFMICLFAAALDEKLDDQKQTNKTNIKWLTKSVSSIFSISDGYWFWFCLSFFSLPNKTQMKTNQLKCIFISQQFLFSLFPHFRRQCIIVTAGGAQNINRRQLTHERDLAHICVFVTERIFRTDLLRENRIRKY